MHIVNSEDIRRCMQATGMDYIQARNHLVAKFYLQHAVEREGRFPQQGKSCYESAVDAPAQPR